MKTAKRIWAFVDRIGWIIAILFVLVAFLRIHDDEQATKRSAQHTREVQVAGGPVAVCLLDALRTVQPLLVRIPAAAEPLESYDILQGNRYTNVTCPTPAEALAMVAKTHKH